MTTLDRYSVAEVRALRAEAASAERRVIDRWLVGRGTSLAWQPLAHQVPPDGDDWFLWLLLGGRGSGKTDGAAHDLEAHVAGPACADVPGGHRVALIAPTLGDGVDSCVKGPSALRAHNPQVRLVQATGGTYVRWPNGAEGKLFGASTPEDVERLRAGGNRCRVWAEELATWRYLEEAWQHMRYGLRLGPNPRVVASTTPKNRRHLRALIDDPRTRVTKATTDDNPFLPQVAKAALYEDYGGTRLGRQELYAELLDDLGATFQRDWFELVDFASGAPATVRYWDLAATPEGGSNPDPDWTVGARVSFTASGRVHEIEDVRRVRATPGQVEDLLADTARVDGREVRIGIEQEPGSSGKAIIAHLKDVLAGYIVTGYRPTGPKEARAQLVQSAAEQGRVRMVRAPWNIALFDELEEFPYGPHDDQVDALSGAFEMLRNSGGPGRTSGRQIAMARLPELGRSI